MPRGARLILESGIFHVMTRGNNRQRTFHDEKDYRSYLGILRRVQKNYPFKLYHYCLMPNHVHLLFQTVSGVSLSEVMQRINIRYAQYYKKRYEHVGHLWQDRFKSVIIEKDQYLLACGAYIELNPVRAKLVKDPRDYSYSSYSYYAFGKSEVFLSVNPYYQYGGEEVRQLRKKYREFVESRNNCSDKTEFEIFSKRAVGSESFLSSLRKEYPSVFPQRPQGRPRTKNRDGSPFSTDQLSNKNEARPYYFQGGER